MVIFLMGDARELAVRSIVTGKTGYTPEKLTKMENALRSVYNGVGVRVVDTRGRSVGEVTKTLSEIIHLEDYEPFDFMARLKAI